MSKDTYYRGKIDLALEAEDFTKQQQHTRKYLNQKRPTIDQKRPTIDKNRPTKKTLQANNIIPDNIITNVPIKIYQHQSTSSAEETSEADEDYSRSLLI